MLTELMFSCAVSSIQRAWPSHKAGCIMVAAVLRED